MRFNQIDFAARANHYLRVNQRDLHLEPLFCNGFSCLWLYARATKQLWRYYDYFDALIEWRPEQGQSTEIEALLNHVVFLQVISRPELFNEVRQNDLHITLNALLKEGSDEPRVSAPEFQLSYNFSEPELLATLEKVVFKGKMVLLGTAYHAFAMMDLGTRYVMYDSDQSVNRDESFLSLKALVSDIFHKYGEIKNGFATVKLGIDIFGLEGKPKNSYPSYDQLLSELKRDEEHRISIELMVLFHHNALLNRVMQSITLTSAELKSHFESALAASNHSAMRRFISMGYAPKDMSDTEESYLFAAIDANDSESVEILLKADVEIDSTDSFGSTALIAACEMRAYDCARKLLAAGANPLSCYPDGDDAMRVALRKKDVEMIRIITTNSSVPKSTLFDNCKSNLHSSLTYACALDAPALVECLLELGANPNAYNRNGLTPLHVCAMHYTPESAKVLLRYKANPALRTKNVMAKTVFAYARGYKAKSVLAILQSTPRSARRKPNFGFFQGGEADKNARCNEASHTAPCRLR